jgi:gliding motility-associated-like protein
MKVKIILFLITISCYNSFSQKQGNIWYFGNLAGIDFNSGSPVALLNGQIPSTNTEGTSCISDSSGALLFYSNGMTIWNKSHTIMQNGSGLLGNSSSTQSSIIVPDPGNPNKYYYIFTVSSGMCCGGSISDGLRYSKVDICLDSSRGAVIPNQKNIKLVDTVAEKIAVTRHANGVDYWILTHKFYSNYFYALHLSPAGIIDTVISSIGTVHNGSLFGTQGQMKFSSNGQRIAVGASNGLNILDVFDFNNSSGVVSNHLSLNKPNNNNATIYGVEFSLDNSKLYATGNHAFGVVIPFLVQYDLSSNNLASINASLFSLYTNTTGLIFGVGLQIGPDGKIYLLSKNNLGTLGVINSPNLLGSSCNYVDQAVSLGGKQGSYSLPSFIANYDYSNKLIKCPCINSTTLSLGSDSSLCQNNTYVLNTNLTNATFNWQDNTSNPTYTVTQQGFYWVEATTNTGCYVSDSINILYNPLPIVNLGNDTTLCQGNSITINTNNTNSSFVWQDNSSNPSYTVTQQGNYWVNVTTSGCSSSDSITVNYIPLPIVSIGNDTTLCAGNTLVLNASTSNASYNWQDNSTNSTFTVNQQGNYWVNVTSNGCSSSDSINVNYSALPIINLGNNINLCNGESITLNATNNNATYVWQDNSTSPTYNVTQQGIYWVSVTENNCSNSDSIRVDIINCDVSLEMPNVFTPNNDQVNDIFIPINANGINNTNLSIFSRWGELLFQTSDMTKGWDGKINSNESPTGTYYWILSYTTIKNENKSLNGFLTLTR